jgi:SAM-dependent methyltransferase
MMLKTVDIMICPDCKSNFEIKEIFKRNEDRIIAGIIGCKCWSYPILDEILIFDKKQIMNTNYLIELLRTGKIETATTSPLELKKFDKILLHFYSLIKRAGVIKKPSNSFTALMTSLKKKRYNEYFAKNRTFFKLMNELKPNTWGDYLKHRFSAESFWSMYPFIPLLKEKNDMILDLGCGAGHVAYIVSKNVSPRKLICVDRDYTLLQTAKRFFAGDAEFICQNLNNPLPFKDGVFSSIIMLDSFHYVANRANLANDLERMLISDGLLLISHLHNSLIETVAIGFALEPSAWESLFSKLKIKSIPEKELIVNLLEKNKLDLIKEYPTIELNKSRANSIMVIEIL